MNSHKKPNVRRVGTSLVATFDKANPPLIWRFDLERNHSFTLAMQGQDGEWELGVTSVKGEFHPVARFPLREDAEEALETVSGALNGGGFAWLPKALKTIGVLLLLFLGAAFLTTFVTQVIHPAANVAQQPLPEEFSDKTPPAPAPPPPPNGVPLSADEVLKPPSP